MKKRISLLLLVILVSLVGTAGADLELKQASMAGVDSLEIDVSGAEIEFKADESGITLSENLIVDKRGSQLYIASPRNRRKFHWFGKPPRKNYQITIGTKDSQLKEVKIDVGGAEIRGSLAAETITINGGGLDINTDLTADQIEINGGGLDISGRIEARRMEINGAGMDVDLAVKKLETIELSGVGMSANIKYLDGWVGIRSVEISGIGGSLEVAVPLQNKEAEPGKLNIEKDGLIKVSSKQY